MVQYYNTGDKDSTNLIAYASDLSMFAMLFTDMQNGTRDYGNDRPIKSVEVAILSTIEQNPGITVSDLSQKQHRTKGTISSIVSNLEKGGYIYREKRPGNAKVVHLYTTPDGERLNTLYIAFVTKKTTEIQSELLKVCSISEMNSFVKSYMNMLNYCQKLLMKNPSREIFKNTRFLYLSFSPQKQEVFSDIYLPNQSRVSKRLHLSL